MAAISKQQADVSEIRMMERPGPITEAPYLWGAPEENRVCCQCEFARNRRDHFRWCQLYLHAAWFRFLERQHCQSARACLGGPASLGRTLGHRTNIEPFPRFLDQASSVLKSGTK